MQKSENDDDADYSFIEELDSSTKTITVYGKSINVFPLIVATTNFGTRGANYRAKTTGITLIVGKSVSEEREGRQLLNRVGREGDDCRRVIIEGVDIVDKD